jgi:hypothetical protein
VAYFEVPVQDRQSKSINISEQKLSKAKIKTWDLTKTKDDIYTEMKYVT